MANPKHIRATEYNNREQRYTTKFNNAAQVLNDLDFENNKMLKALPKDDQILEYLTQYFMAYALGERAQKSKIYENLEGYVGTGRMQTFTPIFLDALFIKAKKQLNANTPDAP